MELNDKQKKIHDQRTKEYGSDGVSNLRNVGLMWTGILQCHFNTELPGTIPSHIVALMMSAVKFSRIAQGVYKEDNYIDAAVYLHIAKKGQTE